uniref:Uncharacterized protein n=1 Tax=Arundo donax TaxID=35708 RepID=A0A0A9H0G9_ARUDO
MPSQSPNWPPSHEGCHPATYPSDEGKLEWPNGKLKY